MNKLIKKLTIIVITVVMLNLVACGEDKAFKGNYSKEATPEQITELTTQLSNGNLFGEEETEIHTGFEMNSNFDAVIKKGKEKMSISFKTDAKAEISQEDEVKLSGNVNLNLDNDITEDDIDLKSLIAKGSIYTDSENFYFNGEISKDDKKYAEGKNKIAIEELLNPIINDFLPDIDIDITNLPDTETITDMLEKYGLKLYIDSSDGFKVKISATQDTLKNIFQTKGIDENVTYTFKKLDLYFSIDKTGKLVGIKLDIDFKMSDIIEEETIELNVKGNFVLKAWDGTVTLPEDLSTYNNFAQ